MSFVGILSFFLHTTSVTMCFWLEPSLNFSVSFVASGIASLVWARPLVISCAGQDSLDLYQRILSILTLDLRAHGGSLPILRPHDKAMRALTSIVGSFGHGQTLEKGSWTLIGEHAAAHQPSPSTLDIKPPESLHIHVYPFLTLILHDEHRCFVEFIHA